MQTLAQILTLPFCSFSSRAELPRVSGVYFVVESNPPIELCYIGQAQNLRQRWGDHHRAAQMYPDHQIHWLACADPQQRDRLEIDLINRFRPRWNSMRTEETIRMLTFRLWLAESEVRSLRFSLKEADRVWWRMAEAIGRRSEKD